MKEKQPKTTRINFGIEVLVDESGNVITELTDELKGEVKRKHRNDQVDVPARFDDKDFSEKAQAAIREKYPIGMLQGFAPTFGNTHYIVGDLLQQDDHKIIVHQANCQKAMYSGIAGAIRKIYPFAVQADIDFPLSADDRFGHCSGAFGVGKNGLVKRIYNLYGQFAPGTHKRMTDYVKLRSALMEMMDHLDDIGVKNEEAVGVPYKIGCGLAGGDWETVETILRDVAHRYLRDIYIYVLPEYAHEVFEEGETMITLPRL
jgi:O-acetyl-ADP-ribose deacetylase (regulator of RNase III)